jgi:cobalt/nickel transport system permease protein
MHISEGILSPPVLAGGGAAAVAGVAYALRKMDYDRVPQVAVVSGAFFVAALAHVPVGPSNAHLALNGLAGVLLGWAAFPAIFVGLFLQAILFQFGGLTTIGVNTVNIALPAVLCGLAARRLIKSPSRAISSAAAFACGAGAVLLSGLMVAASLALVGESFRAVAKIALAAHLPVMIIEGFMTAFLVGFLKKVKPEILEAHDVGSTHNEG